MEDYKERFNEFLKTKGLKLTNQRSIILDYIFLTHDHFNADNLIYEIQNINYEVSRATVYRTIPLLLEAGLIKNSTKSKDKEYYEHVYGHPKHFHIICQKCGKITEVEESDYLNSLISKISTDHNFNFCDYQLIIQGVCFDCK